MVEKLPLSKKIIYSLGQMGWALCSYGVVSTLLYFYFPPPEVKFPTFIHQGFVLWGLTIIGIIFAAGRLVDVVADPIVAWLSDRTRLKFGRRRTFLAIGILPFALFSFLTFYPLHEGESVINTVWLAFCLFIFFWFMTMYVTPYFAWVSELGRNADERLLLATLISITWAVGTMIGSQIFVFQSLLEQHLSLAPVAAFQTVIAVFAALSFILMLLPIIFIDESRYTEHHTSDEKMVESIASALKMKDFLYFTVSDLIYWIYITIINTAMVYYVTVLLQLDKATTSMFIAVLFVGSFLFYVPINFLAKKFGKKRLLLLSYLWLAVLFVYVGFMGKLPLPALPQGLAFVVASTFPLAILSILPNAVVADVAEAFGIQTGQYKAGIFFAARIFMQKIGVTFGTLIIPSLLMLGAEPGGNDIGVRSTGFLASVMSFIGFLVLLRYNEKSILSTLAQKEAPKTPQA
jgi:Na+/melibiose symporter-like transporter